MSDSIQRAKILLVEDSLTNQLVTKGFLTKLGATADLAHNGLEALEMVTQNEYDIVLMDLQMPIMDGFDATRKIRALIDSETLPIVAMTGAVTELDKEKTSEAGMNDHISKPINLQELSNTLHKWIHIKDDRSASLTHNAITETKELSIEGISQERLTEFKDIGFSNQEVEEILIEFLKKYKDTKNVVQNYLENNQVDDLLLLTHTLRGSSGNIGATELQEALKKLEDELKDGRSDDIQEVVKILDKLVKNIEKSL